MSAVVSYREVAASYRDMQGKYQTVLAAREEIRQLRDRLDLDADGEGGRSVGYQLQLILDSLERSQMAEENFLISVVAYNTSLASLERAQGTFLQFRNIDIYREQEDARFGLESLRIEVDAIRESGK